METILEKLPIPFCQTNLGAAYLGNALKMTQVLPDKSINFILTSPPFALTRKKEYRNKSADEFRIQITRAGQFNQIIWCAYVSLRSIHE